MDKLRTSDPTLEPIRGLPYGARALVVEDRRYRPARESFRPGLQSLGLEVFLAPSTDRAARILDRLPIDLLILDIHRADDRRALDWVRTVRQRLPDLVFIAVTDHRSDKLEQECDALGAAAYLAMPVSFRTLRRCIERAFDCRRCLQEIQRLKRQLAAAQSAAARSAPRPGEEPEHQVDDLWFAIFEQLLGSAGRHT